MTTTDIIERLQALTLDDVLHRAGLVLALIVAWTPFASRLDGLVARWQSHAATTPTPYDDRLARYARAVTGCAVLVLEVLVTWLPRLTIGLSELRDATRHAADERRGDGPGVPPTALLVLLCMSSLSLMSACGTTQLERARSALGVSAAAVVEVERVFVPAYERAAAQALEEATSLEGYERTMHRWRIGASAILTTATALLAAESALDAIDASGEGDVGAVLACVSLALLRTLDALSELVDVPEAVGTSARLVAALAGPRCEPHSEMSP